VTYTVIWNSIAEEEFKRLWTRFDDPGTILNAARKIEAELQRNAHDAGEGRQNEETRIIFEPPLGLVYWVSKLDRVAMVTAVWRTD